MSICLDRIKCSGDCKVWNIYKEM